MMAVKISRFPKIQQNNVNWCIPAAVENVTKFHEGYISQDDIVGYYIEKYHPIEDIDFDKVKDILEDYFAQDFSYKILNKHTSKIIGRGKDVIALIKSGVYHGIPPIILMEFPSCWYLPGYSTSCGHYVFTALGVSKNSVLIWDTNPKTINIPFVVENEWILKHLSSDLASFWVIPHKKRKTFETLLDGALA